jgi:chromosome segregation ATPase
MTEKEGNVFQLGDKFFEYYKPKDNPTALGAKEITKEEYYKKIIEELSRLIDCQEELVKENSGLKEKISDLYFEIQQSQRKLHNYRMQIEVLKLPNEGVKAENARLTKEIASLQAKEISKEEYDKKEKK